MAMARSPDEAKCTSCWTNVWSVPKVVSQGRKPAHIVGQTENLNRRPAILARSSGARQFFAQSAAKCDAVVADPPLPKTKTNRPFSHAP